MKARENIEETALTGPPPGLYNRLVKRLLDIVLASLGLLAFAWLFALLGLWVLIKMGRPVIYASDRLGREEKPFKLLKFRSMTNEKDPDGVLLPGPQRLTATGRFLRSSSLDELPSFVNILKGDLSFVGPRPMPVKYQAYFYPQERIRHKVRPGLTGWAQVNGRNLLSWDEKFKYDAYYVQHTSFALDLKILGMTVLKVIRRSDVIQDERRGASLYEERAGMGDRHG